VDLLFELVMKLDSWPKLKKLKKVTQRFIPLSSACCRA